MASPDDPQFGSRQLDTTWLEVPGDGVVWSVDADFLRSSWTCVWGRGCQGILDRPAEELAQGCCSVGAEILDEDEAMTIAALAATLSREQFQFHDTATDRGVVTTESRTGWHTALVDGACIFLNRPDFEGEPGCALHLGAVADGDHPSDWKPSVCWQLPLKVDRSSSPAATTSTGETAALRRWTRADWGSDGPTMAWCCTEEAAALVGDEPVVDSLRHELEALVGREVYVELRRALTGDDE